MGVPKGKRSESKLQLIEECRILRKMVTNLLVNNFGYSEEKFEKQIEKLEGKNINTDLMRVKLVAFNNWFIPDEIKYIYDLVRAIEKQVVMGNNIYISTLSDYDQRKFHFNEASGCLVALNIELQEVVAYLPVDINRYIIFGEQIDKMEKMIIGIKRNDSKIRRKIMDKKHTNNENNESESVLLKANQYE